MKKKSETKNQKLQNSANRLEFAATTNFPSPIKKQGSLSGEEKVEFIAKRMKEIMEVLNLDVEDDSLAKTPHRIAQMYVNEIFSGLDPKQFPEISFIKNEFQHEQQAHIVLVKVSFISFCEHHFVPFNGIAYVAYLPRKKLIGLSKIPQIVRYFAKRPQVQERLTAQIADSMSILLETDDVAVSLTATHYCVIARGIEDNHNNMITNVLRGEFNTNNAARNEFFEGINRHNKS